MVEASAVASKVCAVCGGQYPGDALFCPLDGTPLQSAAAAEREATDPYLGQEISGHIEIRQLVGVGAMGRVYRAFQRGIDRDVAVKILHRELSANASLVSRFTREAKVASRLQHPNVVQVLLAGQLPDRALYMVMEYLDGLSLQSALAAVGGSLPLPRALHIALQLCDAVGEAHDHGIVHRDLKPENVMLVRRGSDPDVVKVLDFGIARINWGEQSMATAAGLIFGTARYISPEGAQGNAVGPASDVYAIGTLLYQMLAGRTPFDGDQAVGLLVQQIHDPAPQLRDIARAANVPLAIAEVVMATLAKDPAKREQDARSLGHAIFDAARAAGLSPEDFSRPARRSLAIQLTPTPSAPSSSDLDPGRTGPPTAATAKWEPPADFQARLVETPAPRSSQPEPSPIERRRSIDETIDDLTLDEEQRARMASGPYFPAPSPAFPVLPSESPRTVVADAPMRTQYTPPSPDAIVRTPSSPQVTTPAPFQPSTPSEPRSRGWMLIASFFLLGVGLAGAWAWKTGKIGPQDESAEEERYVARAIDAMFKNRFDEPSGENVKDLTDEGLRRWPGDRRLMDIRVRTANALTSQAIAQRATNDVHEALKLARIARQLDPNDAAAKRLVEQYEAELASFSASAAPPLTKPPASHAPPPPLGGTPKHPNPPSSASSAQPSAAHVEYKALVDVSVATPRLGQTVDMTAKVMPQKGELGDPGFTIAGPGVPGGVRVPAITAAPGVFKASYAFLEAGKFEIQFTAQAEGGKGPSAKRTVVASADPPSAPPAPPASTPPPAPTPSVKWM